MKNENVHMQALHCKLDVVLVHILCYNCSEDSPPPAGLGPGCGFRHQTLSAPHYFFAPQPLAGESAQNGFNRKYFVTNHHKIGLMVHFFAVILL